MVDILIAVAFVALMVTPAVVASYARPKSPRRQF